MSKIDYIKIYAIPGSGSNFIEHVVKTNVKVKLMPESSFMGGKHGKVIEGKINWNPLSWLDPRHQNGKSPKANRHRELMKPLIEKHKKAISEAWHNRRLGHLFTTRNPYSWITCSAKIHLEYMYNDRDIPGLLQGWNDLHENYMDFMKRNPDISFSITHKESIEDPATSVRNMCNHWGLEMVGKNIAIPDVRVKPGVELTGQTFRHNSKYYPDYKSHLDMSHQAKEHVRKVVNPEVMRFFGYGEIA